MLVKRITKTVLVCMAMMSLDLSVVAEDVDLERYRKELTDAGYTKAEIEKFIIRKIERQQVANAETAKKAEDKVEQKGVEDTVPEKTDNDILSEIENEWRNILKEEKKLSGSELDRILRYEMEVHKELFALDEGIREEKEPEVRAEVSEKRIKYFMVLKSSELGKKRVQVYTEKLASEWEEWFYLTTLDAKKWLESEKENLIEKEIKLRTARAKETRTTVMKEVKALDSTRRPGIRPGIGRGRGGPLGGIMDRSPHVDLMGVYWDKLIKNLMEKEYKKAVTEAKKIFKTKSINADAQKVFFKELDSFVDDDYIEDLEGKIEEVKANDKRKFGGNKIR